MLRSRKWNTMALLLYIQLTVALINVATTFDITRITPIADRNIRTGNKMLYEREINENPSQIKQNVAAASSADMAAAAAEAMEQQHMEGQAEDVLDVNEIPVRYDEAQLWRIYNISDNMRRQMMPVADILENKYGATVWKENSKFLDVSIAKDHLKAARSFLNAHNLMPEILNTNIQELIDMEQMMGVNLTQSEPGQRTKKAARSGIHWKDYHDLDVIYSFMREIRGKFPNICRLYTIGKTAEGRDLKVLR
ncbi:hypothetical protein DOY81_011495 [Sarcophaga bullata]|nr:hypothetical protein DOY81_011495 [Sarcophaga bullata]